MNGSATIFRPPGWAGPAGENSCLNVDLYETYRRPRASIYDRSAATRGGGGHGNHPAPACGLAGNCTNKPNFCPYADPEIGVPREANRATTPRCPASFRQQTQFAQSGRKGRRQRQRPWRCHPSGGGCAKQTQFPAHKISQHSTTISFHRPSPTPIVQNEANFREPTGRAGVRLCKTKPNLGRMGYLEEGEPGKSQWCRTNQIPGGVGWNGVQRCRTRSNCATSPRCPASGNKANSSITDSGGPAVRRLGLPGPVVQTNPIQPGAGGVRSRGRREMRNEPNSRRGRVGRGRRGVGRLCKTNPIPTTGARSLRPGSKPPGVPALVRVYPDGAALPAGRDVVAPSAAAPAREVRQAPSRVIKGCYLAVARGGLDFGPKTRVVACLPRGDGAPSRQPGNTRPGPDGLRLY
jgi:hypothetical protein